MKSVRRRLLVLGGGAAGVEMAQAVRRLGGEAALIEWPSTSSRASRPRSARRSARPCAATARAALGRDADGARRDGADYVLELDDGRELRGDRLLVATGRRPRVASWPGTVGVDRPSRRPGGHAPSRRRAPVGDRRRHRVWPLTHVGKYQGEVVA